jgi:beta-lactamase regulating signal transducer with metallopeptidase domain
MIAWGVTYLVHSTLLIVAVWVATRLIRSASVCETLWKIALVAPLITSLLQTVAPLRDLAPRAAPARIVIPAIATTEPQAPATAIDSETAALAPRPASEPAAFHRLPALLVPLWAAGALLMLGRLLVGHLVFIRSLRDRIDLIRELPLLVRLRGAMNCRAEVRLTQSAAVGTPIAMWGWEIVVPRATYARLSDEQKETILAHEIAHLIRRDPLWLVVGEVMKAVMFVQPLNAFVLRKIKGCAEFLCDDLAVMHTGKPKALAETLAELATSVAPAPHAAAAMAEGGSNLMARVSRVLSSRSERPLRRGIRVAMAALSVLALAALAPAFTSVAAVEPSGDGAFVMEFGDVKLNQTFLGPEGNTTVNFTARDARMPEDAAWVRFTSRSGFLRARQHSERGPLREIEMTAGPGLQTVTRYRVAGVERPWDEEARGVILAAFRTYPEVATQPSRPAGKPPAPAKEPPEGKRHSWKADVETIDQVDGQTVTVRITARGIEYDATTGQSFFAADAILDVVEEWPSRRRQFEKTKTQTFWREHNWQARNDDERVAWLVATLRRHTSVPSHVAEGFTR